MAGCSNVCQVHTCMPCKCHVSEQLGCGGRWWGTPPTSQTGCAGPARWCEPCASLVIPSPAQTMPPVHRSSSHKSRYRSLLLHLAAPSAFMPAVMQCLVSQLVCTRCMHSVTCSCLFGIFIKAYSFYLQSKAALLQLCLEDVLPLCCLCLSGSSSTLHSTG